ncbi:MAG: transposase [Deltaproteobacteria bacterium]|nr:transposase [Deltaproteobacteria bacterium]
MADTSPVYQARNPKISQYYQCVEDNFETLESRRGGNERFAKQYGFFRAYVKHVIYRYLDCGILHNGFARVKCGECGHEFLLAFSCKRRHFCPSCHQKRVVEFGDFPGWHPHLRILVTDGCFYGDGMFRAAPLFELKHLEEIYMHKVFNMLTRLRRASFKGKDHPGTGEYAQDMAAFGIQRLLRAKDPAR